MPTATDPPPPSSTMSSTPVCIASMSHPCTSQSGRTGWHPVSSQLASRRARHRIPRGHSGSRHHGPPQSGLERLRRMQVAGLSVGGLQQHRTRAIRRADLSWSSSRRPRPRSARDGVSATTWPTHSMTGSRCETTQEIHASLPAAPPDTRRDH